MADQSKVGSVLVLEGYGEFKGIAEEVEIRRITDGYVDAVFYAPDREEKEIPIRLRKADCRSVGSGPDRGMMIPLATIGSLWGEEAYESAMAVTKKKPVQKESTKSKVQEVEDEEEEDEEEEEEEEEEEQSPKKKTSSSSSKTSPNVKTSASSKTGGKSAASGKTAEAKTKRTGKKKPEPKEGEAQVRISDGLFAELKSLADAAKPTTPGLKSFVKRAGEAIHDVWYFMIVDESAAKFLHKAVTSSDERWKEMGARGAGCRRAGAKIVEQLEEEFGL